MKSRLTLIFLSLMLFSFNLMAQKYGRYTLVATKNTTAKLLDTSNTVYKTWTLTGTTGYSSYLLPGGVLLRSVTTTNSVFSGGGMHGRVQKVDWSGNIIWDYTYSTTTYCAHHDICPMPNGNVLLIAYELKTATEVSAAGCSVSKVMWPDKIIEVKPTGTNTGTVVWEWHVWDHLVQNVSSSKANYQSSILDHPELININYNNSSTTLKDWMHCNGLDYNEDLDQITFSSHYLNEVYVIDHSTTTAEAASHTGGKSGKGGDILYRWGNPAAYGATGTTNFNTVHDAHWVPKDCPRGGSLAGFNNGATTTQSAADIFYPPYNGYNYSYTAGTAYTPSAYNKRILMNGKTTNEGNSQQLPNGNTIYCIALSGNLYEVDSNGNQVWSYSAGATVSQVSRYSNCYVNGPGSLTATASSLSVCEGQPVTLSSSASGIATISYSWTSDSGYTSSIQNPVINPTKTQTYTVTASLNGCTATSSVKVNVLPKPITPAVLGASTSPVNKSAVYTVNKNANSTYVWNVNGGNITSNNGADSIQVLWNTSSNSAQVKLVETNSAGCKSDTATLTVSIIQDTITPYLSLSKTVVPIIQAGASTTIQVYSNVSWDISTAPSWITLSKSSGVNNDSVVFTVSPNFSYAKRTDSLQFTSGTLKSALVFTQEGLPVPDTLLVSKNLIHLSRAAGADSVRITSNTSWSITGLPNWINLSQNSGNNNATVIINYDSNTALTSRSVTLFFTAGAITRSLLIYQDSTPASINLSEDTLLFPAWGGTKGIIIYSNTSYTMQSNQSWLTLSSNSGSGNSGLDLTVANNNSGMARTANVTITAGVLTKNILVYQDKTTGINQVSKTELIGLYPNPASTMLFIQTDLEDLHITLTDATGREFGKNITNKSVSLEHMNSGIYFYQIYQNNTLMQSGKLLISK